MKFNQKGFTLIELVMVIVILAILGAVAIPKYVNLENEARIGAEAGVVGGVRAGILTFFIDTAPGRGNRTSYPADLDPLITTFPTTCNIGNDACFVAVLAQGGITDSWQKLSATTYRSPVNNSNVWTYTPATGEFVKTTA